MSKKLLVLELKRASSDARFFSSVIPAHNQRLCWQLAIKLVKSSYFGYYQLMQTVTAKEAKNRLGQVIDMALAEKVVAISKNGRDSVVLVSAEYFRELTGKQGFIKDTYAGEKNKRRKEFSNNVKRGRAKSADASMFKGMKAKVKFRNEEF